MYKVSSSVAEEFISHDEIIDSLQFAKDNANNIAFLNEIIHKASNFEGLTHSEAITL